jgi:hypothetical protein
MLTAIPPANINALPITASANLTHVISPLTFYVSTVVFCCKKMGLTYRDKNAPRSFKRTWTGKNYYYLSLYNEKK